MKKVEFTLTNETGLHARPASIFEAAAQRFESDIFIEKDGESYDAKSIIDILCAGIVKGDSIILSAEGSDEAEAVGSLVNLLSNFEE